MNAYKIIEELNKKDVKITEELKEAIIEELQDLNRLRENELYS